MNLIKVGFTLLRVFWFCCFGVSVFILEVKNLPGVSSVKGIDSLLLTLWTYLSEKNSRIF